MDVDNMTEIEFYEVKGMYIRRSDSWCLGFFRSKQNAEERILEELRFDKTMKFKHRRYYIVTHVFRD